MRNILFITLFPVFLLLLSFEMVAFSLPIYETVWTDNNVDISFAKPITNELLLYLQSQGPVPEEFTKEEKSHLYDVQIVMLYAHIIFFLLLLILPVCLKKEKLKIIAKGGLAMILFSLTILLIPFKPLFTYFHYLFFTKGSWVFPYDSLLIQLYPLGFFYGLAIRIFGLALFFGIVSASMKILYRSA